ncbi:MAG: DUF3990 domain-containing protein [Clostridia bacterium]|nr:DUF3990 domain-containing protein [Clostridia bacterium]
MILYHGSNLEIDSIDLNKCRPNKDFGRGFYLTDIPEQAMRMARRVSLIYGGDPIVTSYETDPDALMNSGLSIRRFDRPDIQWATFVMNNRSGKIVNKESPECNLRNQYDIVIGPVANDDMALLFRQFEEGFIDIEILTREMTYKKLTNQYSFHTQRAIALLKKAGVMIR